MHFWAALTRKGASQLLLTRPSASPKHNLVGPHVCAWWLRMYVPGSCVPTTNLILVRKQPCMLEGFAGGWPVIVGGAYSTQHPACAGDELLCQLEGLCGANGNLPKHNQRALQCIWQNTIKGLCGANGNLLKHNQRALQCIWQNTIKGLCGANGNLPKHNQRALQCIWQNTIKGLCGAYGKTQSKGSAVHNQRALPKHNQRALRCIWQFAYGNLLKHRAMEGLCGAYGNLPKHNQSRW